MKYALLIGLLTVSYAAADMYDDLRTAIVTSNIEKVQQIVPTLDTHELQHFIELADTILEMRYKEYYEQHKYLPKITFATIASLIGGLALYRKCTAEEYKTKIEKMFVEAVKFCVITCQGVLTDPAFAKAAGIKGTADLSKPIDFLENVSKASSIQNALYKVGILGGLGLIGTAIWLTFSNTNSLHTLYTNALQIKYALKERQTNAHTIEQ